MGIFVFLQNLMQKKSFLYITTAKVDFSYTKHKLNFPNIFIFICEKQNNYKNRFLAKVFFG